MRGIRMLLRLMTMTERELFDSSAEDWKFCIVNELVVAGDELVSADILLIVHPAMDPPTFAHSALGSISRWTAFEIDVRASIGVQDTPTRCINPIQISVIKCVPLHKPLSTHDLLPVRLHPILAYHTLWQRRSILTGRRLCHGPARFADPHLNVVGFFEGRNVLQGLVEVVWGRGDEAVLPVWEDVGEEEVCYFCYRCGCGIDNPCPGIDMAYGHAVVWVCLVEILLYLGDFASDEFWGGVVAVDVFVADLQGC